MAIRVNYSPSAAAIGGAAFSAGRGRALQRARDQEIAAQERAEIRDQQAQQAQMGMEFQLAQQQQAQQARMGLEQQQQANTLEQIQTRFELGSQERRDAFTEKQHHQLQQLEAMQAAIDADATLTTEMKQRAKFEVQARMNGITPPDRQPKTPQQLAEEAIVEIDGVRGFFVEGKGIVPVRDPSSERTTKANRSKVVDKRAIDFAAAEGRAVTFADYALSDVIQRWQDGELDMEQAETAMADIRGAPDQAVPEAEEEEERSLWDRLTRGPVRKEPDLSGTPGGLRDIERRHEAEIIKRSPYAKRVQQDLEARLGRAGSVDLGVAELIGSGDIAKQTKGFEALLEYSMAPEWNAAVMALIKEMGLRRPGGQG